MKVPPIKMSSIKMSPIKIKRALLSVSNKEGLKELAEVLHQKGVELIASGGTAQFLIKNNFPVTEVEKITKKPEAFQGRMKTLSFEISSSLLYKRNDPQDIEDAKKLDIEPIDLVVVNLYPFHETLKNQKSFLECIENIDIGGPTLLRAAAKNHDSVTVLCDPSQYPQFISEFKVDQSTTDAFRKQCAVKVFTMTAFYDLAISEYLSTQAQSSLRYGENPHQKAVLIPSPFEKGLAHANLIQGKEMSYNNFLDADFSLRTLKDLVFWQGNYSHPTTVIVKHNTPCGIAVSETPLKSLEVAWKGDEKSSFGGVVAVNFEITKPVAEFFKDKFVEVILAPEFSNEAQEILKKNCRLLKIDMKQPGYLSGHLSNQLSELRSIDGGILVQSKDQVMKKATIQSVTKKEFSKDLFDLAEFAKICVKNLKSNAVVVCEKKGSEFQMLAMGSGQTNRVDCIEKLLAPRLKAKGIQDLSQAVMASDAFFPFADNVEAAAKLGIQNIIQPGGSLKDQEVIECANKLGISMAFSGERNFLH